LLLQQKHAEAEPLVRDLLAMREKAEPDLWTTFNTRSMLGGCLLSDKKYADAEALLLQGYEGMKERQARIPPIGKPRLTEAIERLVQLYDAWDKPDEAAKWRKELAESVEPAASDPLPWLVRGRWYANHGQDEKARAQFAQALKLDPDHPLCRLERAKQSADMSAVWDFSQGAAEWSAGDNGRLSMAGGVLTMEGTGRDPMFMANVNTPPGQKVLTICARVTSAMKCQIFWQSETAAWFAGERSVRLDMAGSDGKWREYCASFEAESDLISLRFDLPDEGESKLELAWMVLAGEPSEASLQRAVELAGNDPAPWIERAHWYAKRGEHEKAQADFAQALKLDPEHPLCRLERAKQEGEVRAVWDFSEGPAGWSVGNNAQLTTAKGVLVMEGTGPDPIFIANLNAPAGRKVLTICARVKSAMNCQIFWRTKTGASFTEESEERSVRFDMPGSDGKWHEYRVSFEAESELVSLRFDLPDEGESKLELAWMMLTDDPNP
jgi:Tfp pilus assembly protein PilF